MNTKVKAELYSDFFIIIHLQIGGGKEQNEQLKKRT